ncbi:hypothetical protein [Hyalangium rubrum]|uniref:Zinc ribbon domain-containing protein n=1 Tax=Hyalangium rubrum TaxID=3103134 RepID=A0ABU5H7H8_9BACT|nr:hypothetical protein [Hyalangium sp. s54d21]MDY7229413.1 hypothetical protein [Hyalangium sp. s54d21]
MRGRLLAQGAQALNCPGCGTKVADGTSICPKCDYIIDSSFLSSEPPAAGGDDDESTGAAEAPRAAAPAPRSRPPASASKSLPGKPRAAATANKSGARPSVAPKSRPATKPGVRSVPPRRAPEPEPRDSAEPEEDRPPPPRQAMPPPAQPARTFTGTNSKIVAPEQAMQDAREFITDLPRSDKIAFVGGAVVVFSCFLPWKVTATEGEILGLMSSGFIAFLGALLLLGTIILRVRQTMPRLHPLAPWMAQLGLSIFCVLYIVVFIRLSVDATAVPASIGNDTMMNSKPDFGVFIGLLGGLAAMAGSLLGLKERPT